MAQRASDQMPRSWTTRLDEKRRRMQLTQPWMKRPILPKEGIIECIENLIVIIAETALCLRETIRNRLISSHDLW